MTTLSGPLSQPVLPEHAEGVARQMSADCTCGDTEVQALRNDVNRLQDILAEFIVAAAPAEGATLGQLGKALPFIDATELLPEECRR